MTINNMKKNSTNFDLITGWDQFVSFFLKYHQKECIIVLVNKAITVGSME